MSPIEREGGVGTDDVVWLAPIVVALLTVSMAMIAFVSGAPMMTLLLFVATMLSVWVAIEGWEDARGRE